MKTGTIWQHYKNKKLYEIVGTPLLQENGEWVENTVILYKEYKSKSDKLFIRDIDEFLAKFKQIKGDKNE